jgi:hypothetical protein
MNAEAFRDCLRRLVLHVDVERIALAGGVAIGLHAGPTRAGRSRIRAAEDLDFVAERVEAVRESVTEEFLVAHFHMPQPGYSKFLIQLVDPANRLRLDFFPDALRVLSRAALVDVEGTSLRVVSARDILGHKLSLLSGASVANPVDQKHYADAKRLAVAYGCDIPMVARSHFARTIYSQSVAEACPRCSASRDRRFPLASRRVIFDLLGYV